MYQTFTPEAKDERAKVASGTLRRPQMVGREELRSDAADWASEVAMKASLGGDDVCGQARGTEFG